MPGWLRRPLFGRHGKVVVAALCSYEVAALAPGSPLPTLTALCRRYPAVRVGLSAALAHHWWLEAEEMLEALEDAAS